MAYNNEDEPDPSRIGWPAQLPIELALAEIPTKEIFASYGLTKADYLRLGADEGFCAQVVKYKEALKTDGVSFEMKARLQADALLQESWRMIHAPDTQVPPAVKADLIKSTMKWAGHDQKATRMGDGGPALKINIMFGSAQPVHPVKVIEG